MYFKHIIFNLMNSNRIIWFKDKFINEYEAKIPLMSPTAQFGLNVFEGIRCYFSKTNKKLLLFRVDDHINRLYNSAKSIGLIINEEKTLIKKNIIESIKQNKFKSDSIMRVIAFVDQPGSWTQKYNAEIVIVPRLYGRAYEEKSSLTLHMSNWERINNNSMPPTIKSGANYINSRIAHLDAQKNGFDTSILLNNQGNIAESTGSCIFIIKDEKLITPPITSSILDSITRKTILEISAKILNIKVVIKDITKNDLINSDEVFLCGTSIEVFPVSRINDSMFKLGKITQQIKKLYMALVRGEIKEYDNWLTLIN
jgi:branched-chain amino acid aminotransferase